MWKYTGQVRPDFAVEPGPEQESVWDYPRPPAIVNDARRVRVMHNDICLADTTRSVRVLETASPPTFYLPPDDVNVAALDAVSGQSWCEWKGAASYLALSDSGQAVAWFYATPSERFAALARYISFYPARVACYVDDERVRPQPGGFYGGWLTDEIVGPVKGEGSTGHW